MRLKVVIDHYSLNAHYTESVEGFGEHLEFAVEYLLRHYIQDESKVDGIDGNHSVALGDAGNVVQEGETEDDFSVVGHYEKDVSGGAINLTVVQ